MSYSRLFFVCLPLILLVGCYQSHKKRESLNFEQALGHCAEKLALTVRSLKEDKGMPRAIPSGQSEWSTSGINSWTSGFFPGMLWQMYSHYGSEKWLQDAGHFTRLLEPVKNLPWKTHDLGFMMYCSYGKGYQYTREPYYKDVLLETADSLATLFNPRVGTILSWPWMKRKKGWMHNTIIDNMMNLELLFWAAQNGGSNGYYDIAVAHAKKTMKDHVRPDFSTYHVVVYDSLDPHPVKRVTFQGHADESTWARGQAWAIYGFTMCHRETGDEEFLKTAQHLARFFLDHLPGDHIPYWDFNDPEIPEAERDASAAAIAASALLDLASQTNEEVLAKEFKAKALAILSSLYSEAYRSDDSQAILKHSVGNKPGNSEIDVSLVYADYYFIEALLKARSMSDPAIAASEYSIL